jgi:hypothetical protein
LKRPMKRTLIIPLMVCLLVGVTACQISLPSKDPGVTKTLLADTPAQPTQTAAEPLAPTETPSAEPTFTPTNPPPSPTVDPVLDPSRLVVESRNHLEENTALPGFRINVSMEMSRNSSTTLKPVSGQMQSPSLTTQTLGQTSPVWILPIKRHIFNGASSVFTSVSIII